MKKPKLSIITVCFNAENTIEQTIQSVIKQSYENIEYIIIDGNSTDTTLSIINKYSKQLSQIISEPDNGIYNAMNKGAKLSTGEYLLFLNADDYLLNNSVIKNTIMYITNSKESDIYYGDLLIYDHANGHGKIWSIKSVTGSLLYNSTLPHPASFIKRNCFEMLGGYNESYRIASDFDFFVRAFLKGQTFNHTNVLTSVFSIGGISTADSGRKLSKTERHKIINLHFKRLHRLYLIIRVRIKKIFNI